MLACWIRISPLNPSSMESECPSEQSDKTQPKSWARFGCAIPRINSKMHSSDKGMSRVPKEGQPLKATAMWDNKETQWRKKCTGPGSNLNTALGFSTRLGPVASPPHAPFSTLFCLVCCLHNKLFRSGTVLPHSHLQAWTVHIFLVKRLV